MLKTDFVVAESLTTEKKVVPVIIMAGGMGTRLEPFTKIIPKPLIPIGDKTIIEVIIEEFRKQGLDDFYLTLNYKYEMIKSYFNSITKNYKISYIKEDAFLGTAGSLKLLKNIVDGTFIVSNCDVIVKTDFNKAVDFHNEKKACLTVIGSIQQYKIPYGVINLDENNQVKDVIEKPEYKFTVNTGVYILNSESLQFIPKEESFNMTDLIKVLAQNGKKVLVYPINENDYIDIGQWEEYKKTIEKIQFLK